MSSGTPQTLTSPSKLQANTAPRLENTPFTPFSTLGASKVATGVPTNFSPKTRTTIKLSEVERETGLVDSMTNAPNWDGINTWSIESRGTDSGSMTGMMPPLFENSSKGSQSFIGSRPLPKAPVHTSEVNLSARSFSERMLVDMRDSSISVGQEQVKMLTKQNDQLRRNLNEVEAEMITLQEALEARDGTIHHKDRELEEIQRECQQLMAEMQKAEGRESAMDLAAKQNTHLLRLLEQEEAKREVLSDDKEALTGQLEVVRDALTKTTRESTEIEATLKERMKRTRQKAFEKTKEADEMKTKAMQVEASLKETERIAKFEIGNMKDELVKRREKVYELLDKLQKTEDDYNKTKDSSERQQELLDSSYERANELERRLQNARLELAEREGEVAKREEELNTKETEFEERTEGLRRENTDLEKQLGTASQTILDLVERHKSNQIRKEEDDLKFEALQQEHELTRDQNVRLLESLNVKSKAYIQLEADHADAQAEIQKMMAAEEETPRVDDVVVSVSVDKGVGGGKDAKNPKKLLAKEAAARRQLFENFAVSVCHVNLVSDALGSKFLVEARNALVLDNCNIDDVDMITLVSVLKGSKTILELNLISNKITDAGATALAGYLSLANCKLSYIDLRNNFISMSGVRKLAEALQGNKGRGLEHVYVHNDGRIDGIGLDPRKVNNNSEEKKEGGGGDTTVDKLKNAMSSICVIDVRENFPEGKDSLGKPVGTEKTLWKKIGDELPTEEEIKIKARKARALKERKKNAEYRDEVVGNVYG
ncbi:hypothetical protein TL16_g12496 [Triparma laevis f. inornata]|uniref:RNI-like protein n=1 Tax=Triparma laevis f. inornata TaxID=1714386 RepID=A0A9W7BLN6_9STRA|nr:hypothetical protein TL16_g12496 [Triparma laevis f. inornata]